MTGGPLALLRRSLAAIRVLGVVAVSVIVLSHADFPPGYELWAWVVVLVFGVEAVALATAVQRDLTPRGRFAVDVLALVADYVIVLSLLLVFSFEPGQPLRPFAFFLVIEAALRFGRRGGLLGALGLALLLVLDELWRNTQFDYAFETEAVAIRSGLGLVIALVVGRLVDDFLAERSLGLERAAEAERLRDELGRRVDVLEAANRAARALSSSLELDQAFGAFIRELRGVIPFDRMAIVLAEDGSARVMATAGRGADELFPPGSVRPMAGSVLEETMAGHVVYREDMSDPRHPEEARLLELGLRCRLVAPLLHGARTIGMIALVRSEPRSFTPEEIELASLLGRLVATGVQNIRAYEAERRTVEELRRLSALRADFVSLVSHELRSPMAAVIGSARTLQQRWRELTPEQRESFLELIAGETTRLAALIGDVLDTSRIEAGTFSYSFSDVDVGALVRDTVAAASIGQDEVGLAAKVREGLPRVRGDRERLRQVLMNLIENAVKYSPAGEEVRVAAYAHADRVLVDVSDRGPGIAPEHQKLIFEKFGRVTADGTGKPGTGLGLFIARSIAEAHGGSLDVRSPGAGGTTFTLILPALAA